MLFNLNYIIKDDIYLYFKLRKYDQLISAFISMASDSCINGTFSYVNKALVCSSNNDYNRETGFYLLFQIHIHVYIYSI